MIRLFRTALVLTATVFALAKPAMAAPVEGGDELDADQAVRAAVASNRDLQAALLEIEIARGRLLQAGRLSNPEINLSWADDFASRREGERAGSVELAQSFPITARLARERDVAQGDLRIAEAEVRDFARGLIAETLSAFYALLNLDRQIEVNSELVESVRQVEDATQRRLRAAEVSPAEVSLLRIERLRLDQEARRLVMEREMTQALLARLLGRDPGAPLRPLGDLEPAPGGPRDDSNLVEVAVANRPDLIAARRAIVRAEADRNLARAEVWQDWTIGVGYEAAREIFDPPQNTKRDSFLTFGLTVPLPLFDRQQGRIAAAEAEARRSRRVAAALELRIAEEVRSATARFKALRLQVDAYGEQVLPESVRTRSLFQRGYRQGLVGIAELIQSQRQHSEVSAAYAELQGNLHQASVDLEAATAGSPYLDGIVPMEATR